MHWSYHLTLASFFDSSLICLLFAPFLSRFLSSFPRQHEANAGYLPAFDSHFHQVCPTDRTIIFRAFLAILGVLPLLSLYMSSILCDLTTTVNVGRPHKSKLMGTGKIAINTQRNDISLGFLSKAV